MYQTNFLIPWLLLLHRQSFTFAAHYLSIQKQNGFVLPSGDLQSINVRSRIECILKCRTKLKKKNGFYTEDNSCFCSNGNFEASNDGNQTGTAYYEIQKHKAIPFSQEFQVDKVPVGATTVEETLQNIIPIQRDNWQLTFKTWRNESANTANILRLTAAPVSQLPAEGNSALLIHMRPDKLKIKTTTSSDPEFMTTINIDFPLNQEVEVKIVNYACQNCPVRLKIFFDGVEKFSNLTTSSVWYNVSCFVPWVISDNRHEATDIKYISNVPLFGTEQSFDEGTTIATIPSWPAGNSAFHVSFKLKINAWSDRWKPILTFDVDGASFRLAYFYFNNHKIVVAHKVDSGDFDRIGTVSASMITLGHYHKCSLRQEKDGDDIYKVKFFFDDEWIGQEINYLPDLTFSNVKIKVYSKDDFDVSFKEFDYSGSD